MSATTMERILDQGIRLAAGMVLGMALWMAVGFFKEGCQQRQQAKEHQHTNTTQGGQR